MYSVHLSLRAPRVLPASDLPLLLTTPFSRLQANEDNNCYTFDMRKLDHASCIHKDHVSAVMSLDYAPTGKEFVTGSYDRTVRIFRVDEGHARDIYFTKRMQK